MRRAHAYVNNAVNIEFPGAPRPTHEHLSTFFAIARCVSLIPRITTSTVIAGGKISPTGLSLLFLARCLRSACGLLRNIFIPSSDRTAVRQRTKALVKRARGMSTVRTREAFVVRTGEMSYAHYSPIYNRLSPLLYQPAASRSWKNRSSRSQPLLPWSLVALDDYYARITFACPSRVKCSVADAHTRFKRESLGAGSRPIFGVAQ